MREIETDLNTFEDNHQLYDEISFIATVKSFDLQAIRNRYIKSAINKNNKIGSVERREPAVGGIVYFKIKNGKIIEEQILCKISEPRGIDIQNDMLTFSSDKTVYVFNGKEISEINYEWFSYIHTVEFSPFDNNKILVSSSGLDSFFEFNFKTKEKTYEWFAWENGINEGYDSTTESTIKITRDANQASIYNNQNIRHKYIANPKEDYLPTAHRSAFINSVHYALEEKKFIATLFHKGEVRKIDANGTSNIVVENLASPHGGQELAKNHFIATNTREGEFIEIKNNTRHVYSFQGLDKNNVGEKEWIQNSHKISENLILSIDSNRNEFVIIDTTRKQKSRVSFNKNWAIQDFSMVDLSFNLKNLNKKLNQIF